MNSFSSKSTLTVGNNKFDYFSLEHAEKAGAGAIARMPFSLKVMLENLLRFEDGSTVSKEDVIALVGSAGAAPQEKEIAFRPARVDAGLRRCVAVVDLLRCAMSSRRWGRPEQDQSTPASRSRDRPFRPGRSIRTLRRSYSTPIAN
jgi:aconitase A